MKYTVISNGEVINTIVASVEFAKTYAAQTGYTLKPIPNPEPEAEPEQSTLEGRVEALESDLDILLTGLEGVL